ncbi:DNA repair protein rhp42 [Ceratocystis platani]|uniref:DNA repair protein rhp42 n=1 Tax=Ceratocystis fimbriata f. sp. platani TaxID=88771 RepID=A0A0F8BKQ9_CERFI|nr:DNA repair protein rhp42 [Ceratocystis platani]
MPPHVTRKRLREEDDESTTKAARPGRRKATLYDGLDAVSIPNIGPPLQTLFNKSGKDQDDESDMSSSGSEEEGDFEDVPLAKRRKVELSAKSESGDDDDDASSSSEDDMVFEDVPVPMPDFDCAPAPTGDLELTLRKDTRISMTNNSQKKGPTKHSEDDSEDQDDHEEDDLTMEFDDSDEDSVVNVDLSVSQTPRSSQKHDIDLEFPIYWTEVLSPITNRYIPVDATVKKAIGSTRELIELLEPRGGKADKARQIMAYVIGHSADGTAKDVTVRYLRKQMFPGRTKGYRLGIEKIAVRNRHGKVKRYDYFDWFGKVMACFARQDGSKKYPITNAELQEDSTDLQPAKPEKKEVKEGEETLQYFKTSPEFVLERHLKREEALLPDAEIVRYFKTKVKGKVNEEPIYRRSDVVNVKSAETWHKQGRAPKSGEIPLKRVPYRAATNNRRRELAEAEAATGQKALQGLYSMEQTDWIIPDPIQNGVIPKNNYGNIDLFAAHMCPQGAVHVPYRGAMRACKKLGYDYAEAVVDFEFGHRMAVPVIQGVVCAEEYYDAVMEQVRIDEAERQRKEDEKRRKNSLAMWRKLLKGLRIIERVRADYGEVMEGFQVFGRNHQRPEDLQREKEEKARALADMGGGFIPEGYEEDIEHQEDGADQRKASLQTSSFFPVVDDDDDDDDGGLVVEDTRVHEPLVLPQTSLGDERNEGILDSDDDALSEPGSDAEVEPNVHAAMDLDQKPIERGAHGETKDDFYMNEILDYGDVGHDILSLMAQSDSSSDPAADCAQRVTSIFPLIDTDFLEAMSVRSLENLKQYKAQLSQPGQILAVDEYTIVLHIESVEERIARIKEIQDAADLLDLKEGSGFECGCCFTRVALRKVVHCNSDEEQHKKRRYSFAKTQAALKRAAEAVAELATGLILAKPAGEGKRAGPKCPLWDTEAETTKRYEKAIEEARKSQFANLHCEVIHDLARGSGLKSNSSSKNKTTNKNWNNSSK